MKNSKMTDEQIVSLFASASVDLEDLEFLQNKRPLLAHYTSLEVLEKIVKSGEIWLSNPLFMNDLEEVRFGVTQGIKLVEQSGALDASCKTKHRATNLRTAFSYYSKEFELQHAFDTYVFCLSEHDPEKSDGLLSMWRGYGRNGAGAALVFNSNFAFRNEESPILISRVHYETAEQRISWMRSRLEKCYQSLDTSQVSDDQLYIVADVMFNLVKLFALKSKHNGFSEEREWRIIYLPERDSRRHAFKMDYVIGKQGIEPKLRFAIKPIDHAQTWTFGDILEQIILGPSVSSVLARRGVERMLETVGKPEFKDKLSVSSIPLRPA